MGRSKRVMIATASILFMFVLSMVLYVSIRPSIINVKPLEIASEDVRSPTTIEDTEATARLKQEAVNQVGSQFSLREEFADQQIEKVEQLFAAFEGTDEETKLSDVKNRLNTAEALDFLDDESLEVLLKATDENRKTLEDVTITALAEVMSERIDTSAESIANAKARADVVINDSPLTLSYRALAKELTDNLIVPNYVFDVEETRKKEQEAIDAIEPVILQEGQLLVRQGEIVTREIYRKLELTGAINTDRSRVPLIGSVLLSVLMTIVLVSSLYISTSRKLLEKPKLLYVLYGLLLGQLGLFMLVSWTGQELSAYVYMLAPTTFVVFLTRMLIDEHTAIVVALFTTITGPIVASIGQGFSYTMAIYFLTSSFLAVFLVHPKSERRQLLRANAIIAVMNVIVVFVLFIIRNVPYSFDLLVSTIIFVLVASLLNVVLTSGFLPFLEPIFGVLSTSRLVELLSPTNPLLRKLLMEAPGTYHHSMMVANLAESACEAIGADGLLARVSSYYHDLGKTRRAGYFIENQQSGINPHDHLSPEESADIIIAHPYDGADLLRQHKFPKEVIDVAEQHHGTSLLRYFYVKASEASDGRQIDEARFRYPGPKPSTREAAVVMIVDSIEAAVRAQKSPTSEAIRNTVDNIIREKLADGQFDQCELTTKEIWMVGESACETLTGLFHERIEYPDMKKEGMSE